MKPMIGLIFLCLAFQAHAAEENEFKAFFSEYETLDSQFDIALANLYSDEAKVIGVRLMPDASEKTVTFDGKKWKQLIVDLMVVAKEAGDNNKFSNIAISENGDGAKITATRYSPRKCYEDKDYYMVVKRNAEGRIEIIEEFSKSPQQSKCENPTGDDLALTLQAISIRLGKQLPVMLDTDTRLEKISAEGHVLTYQYELVNFASGQLDAPALEAALKPSVVKLACATSNMKSIIDQGGTIFYRYNGNDKVQVVEILVNKESCK